MNRSTLGIEPIRIDARDGDRVEHVIVQRPLHRVLAFTRRSIDDVVNDPIARNQVRGYFKLYKWVRRESEISDLEHQWNPI
jgi:hypothetical protein